MDEEGRIGILMCAGCAFVCLILYVTIALTQVAMQDRRLVSCADALAGAGVFILLALAAPLLDRPWPRAVGTQLAKISYAVFLVHHVLIQELAAHFDLAVLSRRDTAFLFVVYLAATFAAAHALLWLQRTLRTGLAALRSPI